MIFHVLTVYSIHTIFFFFFNDYIIRVQTSLETGSKLGFRNWLHDLSFDMEQKGNRLCIWLAYIAQSGYIAAVKSFRE